jgi:TonB family protein
MKQRKHRRREGDSSTVTRPSKVKHLPAHPFHSLGIKSPNPQLEMKVTCPSTLLALFFLMSCLPSAQAQNENPKQTDGKNQAALPKTIKRPMAPYPEEANRKGIEGIVTLSIVVDANGSVSEAKALSGPDELVPAALASVRMWQFEPPASGPIQTIVEIGYGHEKDCPGTISDWGEVVWSWRLRDVNNKIIAVAVDDDPSPPYPEAERKSGVSGTMILSVTLDQDGHVKEIHVVKSLSPALDKAAMDTVRPMKFKRVKENPNAPLEDLRLEFNFRATCNPTF